MIPNFSDISVYLSLAAILALVLVFMLGRWSRPQSSQRISKGTAPTPPVGPAKLEHLEAAPVQIVAKQAAVLPEPSNWHIRLVKGLKRTHSQIVRSLDEFLISREAKATREEVIEKLFEVLVQADVGVRTSEILLERMREKLTPEMLLDVQLIRDLLKSEILFILQDVDQKSRDRIAAPVAKPHCVMMVGVNGVGKTTTVGKLAFKAGQHGQSVSIGAADTFRAAAVEQLRIWAERSRAEFVQLKEGADPASVAYECVKTARAKNCDLCFVDTAGRLHNRQDLMQELAKIRRVMGKELEGAPHEVLLVIDATTGQNALQQARIFKEIVDITGVVLTKLDGTAKGGIAIAIVNELHIPIRYIGVGEAVEDLEPFDAREFVEALFEETPGS